MSHEEPLPKAYDPSIIEQRWADYWIRERLFDVPEPTAATGDTAKPFTVLLPPPNVTGRLHMGHMLNQTEIDILIRWRRMSGDTALWVPGTDHAGIATQMMVERQLASEGTDRKALGREAFTTRVWEWKEKYGSAITDQMRRLGASVDWSREYFTMDPRLSIAVKEAFVRLWEQGLIYRGSYIVNWDPVLQTAVSDLEVESEERVGKLYYIRYPFAGATAPFDDTNSIEIATTRPETMLGDVAVAVNPNDERYKHLIGTRLQLPLTNREIPILGDDWANPEFGTGAVKVTPAHDPNDFAIGQRHPEIGSITIFDETAHIKVPGGSAFDGLDRFVAREKIVAELGEIGLLGLVKDHPMTLPVSQRSGSVIEPRLSMQWFVAVNKPVSEGRPSIARTAIEAVQAGHIRFTPEMYSKTYFEWMNNIHDWCISRQLWWGHRIPAWHCDDCKKITVARDTPTACASCGSTKIVQDADVLDTWFSSGLLPFTVFGWPEQTPDMQAFYPTQLLITGFDILFFWVARMIMLGTHFMLDVPKLDTDDTERPRTLAEAVPFQAVYIHALVRDANREKMSKTKGNVIDPIGIVEKYGTDAVRFTLASMASPGTDIAFSEARTEGNRAFANKIWNAARFLFMNLARAKEAGIALDLKNLGVPCIAPSAMGGIEPLETRWIITRLSQTAAAVSQSLTNYRFDEAANLVYQFFWGDLCDWYLEIVKLRLNFGETDDKAATSAALTTFIHIFESALRLLSPFMPFLTEEIWHALFAGIPPAKSIALTRYPQPLDYPVDERSVRGMGRIQSFVIGVRSLRKGKNVPEKETVPVFLEEELAPVSALFDAGSGMGSIEPQINNVYIENRDIIFRLARVSQVHQKSDAYVKQTPELGWIQAGGPFIAIDYQTTIDIPAERERLTKDLAKYEKGLTAAERQLGNEAFMAKAPAHIVEGLRKQAAETRTLYDKTKAALDALG